LRYTLMSTAPSLFLFSDARIDTCQLDRNGRATPDQEIQGDPSTAFHIPSRQTSEEYPRPSEETERGGWAFKCVSRHYNMD